MKRFLKGFSYAGKGLIYAFSTQINFKVHFFAVLLVSAAGVFFKIDRGEWLWLMSAMGIVLMAELFNTAIEVLTDLVSPQYHPKAGIVKDLASAAVLVSAVFAFITGMLIFIPKIY